MLSFIISILKLVVLAVSWLLPLMPISLRLLRRILFPFMSASARIIVNFCMRNRFLSVVACILVCSLVIMPFSAFADDVEEPFIYDPPQELWDESAVYAIWLILRAWGINITAGEIDEWSQAVSDEIESQVVHYLESLPSPISIFSWVNPWLWDVDFWGQARFNSNMLEDIQDFAEWLVDTLDLSDNSTHVINPVYSVNGMYTLYEFDKWYAVNDPDGISFYQATSVSEYSTLSPYGYFLARPVGTNDVDFYIVYPSGTPHQVESYQIDFLLMDMSTIASRGTVIIQPANNNGLFYARHDWMSWNDIFPQGDYFEYSTSGELDNFLANFYVVTTGNMSYVTLDISLPVENPDYTPGDSLIIIGDEPTYEVFDWDGRVTVENLPAVISKTNLENPGLIELFRPVQSFVTTFSDGLALVRGIVYEFPSEAITILFTLMGCAILIGIIHIMKEH